MIRLGLIGCGEHSESGHAISLARYKSANPGQIELVAACDMRLERAQGFCARYGFLAAYRDIDEMLNREKFDGMIAVVPPEGISALGIKLLRMGIPCVVEKPLGASLAEAIALRDAAAASPTPNMVSVNRRFMPFLNRAIAWTRSSGSLRYVRCTLARHARRESEFLWATAVHAVDTVRFLAGQVAAFEIRSWATPEGATPWHAVDLRFENGILGRIDVLPTTGMVEETYDLFGEGFRASVTCPFGIERRWRCFRDGRLISDEVAAAETPEDIVNGCYDEAAEFIRALRSTDRPHPSIGEVFPSVELSWTMGTTVSAQRE
jgi:myo-inositol 2-dehydrogenase / D-chiro-inositol 1-dehydrogenase